MVALFRLALAVGLLAFGGGFAIIANIKQRVVDDLGWLSAEEFAELVGVTSALPGTNAANLLTLVGVKRAGAAAGAIACVLFLLPGITLMVGFAIFYDRMRSLPAFGSVLEGITAAVVGIVASAADELRPSVVKRGRDALLVALSFAALVSHRFTLLEVVAVAGFIGVASQWKRNDSKAALMLAAAPGALGKGSGILVAFAKISLATFGGGVAMIPAVEREVLANGWTSGATFTDAIALSQITPGPIAVCSTFIGYRAAGALGALAATIGVFVPPLILTLVVARSLPRLREKPVVRAFLSGVSIAVVAAIAAAAFSVYRVGVFGLAWTLFAVAVFAWRRVRPKHSTFLPVAAGAVLGLARSLFG